METTTPTAPLAHTPGPWVVRHLTGFPLMIATQPDADGFGVPVADCSKRNLPAEAQANARLIAAAPELLQLLESCIRVMQRADELSSDARYWIELGTNLIAKAKGIA